MRFEVLPKKILTVIVAVRRSHDYVDMLARRNVLGAQMRGSHRTLMVELDENHRTMNAVVKDRVVARSPDPIMMFRLNASPLGLSELCSKPHAASF